IGGEGFDQCNVTVDWVFQHIVAAVDFSDLFALGQHGAVTGGGEECSDTSPCGTESFGQIALGAKLQFDFACPIGLIEGPSVLLPTVRSLAPEYSWASINSIGWPASPKPPISTVEPSEILATACAAVATFLVISLPYSASSFSTTMSTPCPTPTYSAARSQRRFSALSRRAKVPSTRDPEAPNGWPRAIAPPHALTR